MFETLQEIDSEYGISCADKYEDYADYIINMFNRKESNESLDSISHDATKLHIHGLYHDVVTKNYTKMEKYYLMAIELGNADAMNNLGVYHYQITNNYVEMEKYYLMVIELGDADAMNNLGVYHHIVTKNYVEMEKYYLMAIELGNAGAMFHLGVYHHVVTKNYAEMEKYYLMAIELGNAKAKTMAYLAQYHQNNVVDLFKCLDRHFDSKSDHTDAFLIEYRKLLKEDTVQSHIQDAIDSRCMSNNNVVNKHLYEKYIQTGEKVTAGAYASNFSIVATLTGSNDDAVLSKTYHVHSHVLNTEYFLNLIDSGFMEASSVSIKVTDFAVVELLLKYLYLNEFASPNTLSKEHWENLRQIADEFGFEALTEVCAWTAKLNGLYR